MRVNDSNGPSAREVFEILARDHADMLAAYLRSLVWSPPAAEDLFQETMLVAWRRLGDFDRSRPFGAWLRGIARRLALEDQRRRRALPTSIDPEVLAELDRRYEDLAHAPGDTFRQRAERLIKCLARLPEHMRAAIEMVYSRQMLLGAAAQALDASEEAVKKRIQRARQLLAECVRTGEVEA